MRNWRKVILFVSAVLTSACLWGVTKTSISDLGDLSTSSGASSSASKPASYSGTISLEPSKVEELDDADEAVVIIKSNVSGADVYLNGNYQGKTTCTINDIKPGKYKLEVKKTNYEVASYTIQIQKGYELTYEVKLVEIRGEIEIKNAPSGAAVYIDGSKISGTLKEIIIGNHTVKVRKFGYNDFEQTVEVLPYKRVTVTPKLIEAPFSLSDFKISRAKINPDYSSGIGKVKVSFYVTNKETAALDIYGSNGALVCNYKFPEFSTWEQSWTWNGKSGDGEDLPDGLYYIELKCAGETYTETVTISRAMIYPMMNATPAGLGYGRLTALEPMGIKFCNISFFASPVFEGNQFSTVKMDFAVNGAFNANWSAGLSFNTYTSSTGLTPNFTGTGSVLYNKTFALGHVKGMIGGQLRYGYSLNSLEKLGVDYGAGLGATILAGAATDNYSVTVSGQYIAGCKTGNVAEGENMISGGISIAGKPVKVVTAYAYGSCNNYNVVSAGAGVNAMPFGSLVMLSLGASADAFLNKNFAESVLVVGIRAGISLIF